jgi:hypothetical protein
LRFDPTIIEFRIVSKRLEDITPLNLILSGQVDQ